jgi:beta-exotoxin I transport system ATP-binding protein
MTAAIELRDLSKDYGSVRALDGVSLRVEPGEIIGFLGPNGAGKSTSIRILFDLIRPTSGSAQVLGFDCQRDSLAARQHMGYLPGEMHLYEGLTGHQTIDYFATLRQDRPAPGFVEHLVASLDLDPARRVGAYSKGNRQKLGLILAMMHQPDVLVLDEPTSGLDPLIQDEVAKLLFEFAAEGRTVFFSSHVMSEVERMCHRAAFLREGKLVAVEDVGAIKGRSLHIVEVTFTEPVPAAEFQIEGVHELQRDGNTLHLEVHNNLDAVLKAIAHHRVVDLRTEQPSLEQVFRAYYHDGGREVDTEANDAAS